MIGKTNVSCPAYADDLALMALYKPGLNKLLQIAYDHSVKWNDTFSIEQSVVVFEGKDTAPHTPVTFGNGELSVVSESKHMGAVLSSEKK